MYVWTKKAEREYRERHPHRKNERKAGTVVTWEGKELGTCTILEGYASRGWVAEHGKKVVIVKTGPSNRLGRPLTTTEQGRRWLKLMKYFAIPDMTVKDAAKAIGLKSANPINDLIAMHGKELAAKYGKLPKIKGVKKSYWLEVMEG